MDCHIRGLERLAEKGDITAWIAVLKERIRLGRVSRLAARVVAVLGADVARAQFQVDEWPDALGDFLDRLQVAERTHPWLVQSWARDVARSAHHIFERVLPLNRALAQALDSRRPKIDQSIYRLNVNGAVEAAQRVVHRAAGTASADGQPAGASVEEAEAAAQVATAVRHLVDEDATSAIRTLIIAYGREAAGNGLDSESVQSEEEGRLAHSLYWYALDWPVGFELEWPVADLFVGHFKRQVVDHPTVAKLIESTDSWDWIWEGYDVIAVSDHYDGKRELLTVDCSVEMVGADRHTGDDKDRALVTIRATAAWTAQGWAFDDWDVLAAELVERRPEGHEHQEVA